MKKIAIPAGLIAVLVMSLVGYSVGMMGGGNLWLPESAYAGSGIFDPAPDPIAAGWTAESIVLDPEDISSFTLVGTQAPATGPELLFADSLNNDVSGLYAIAPWAAIGTTVDIIATFQVTSQASHGVDAGFQLVINDGANNRAAIMSAILINNLPHIGLVGNTGPRDQLATYPAFIQAEWQAAPLTVHLRRWADGRFEVLELNGAPPSYPVFLPASLIMPGTRAFGSIDFGSFSPTAIVNASVSEFRAFTVPDPSCTPVRPELGLSMANVYWGSYQDYIQRELSVDYLIANGSPSDADGVRVVGTISSAGVTSINTPLVVGGIAGGSSASATIKYDVPIGVSSFRSTVYATSEDLCGGSNSYPGPYGS